MFGIQVEQIASERGGMSKPLVQTAASSIPPHESRDASFGPYFRDSSIDR